MMLGIAQLRGKSIPVFALMTIIFLSACVTREVRTDANSGLAIDRFFADPERIDSGELFRVHMEIENVGERTAKSVRLELLSSPFEGQEVGPQRPCANQLGQPVRCPIGQPLPPFTTARTEKIPEYSVISLAPPRPEFNQPGEFRLVSWDLQAPYIPEGVVKDFRLLGKVTYEYATSSVITLPVYTKNEFRQRKDLQSIKVENTRGPIKIEIAGPQQIVVNTDPDAININKNEILVYTITVKNSGGGIPTTNGINGLVAGSVKFVGGITPLDCLPKGKTERQPVSQIYSPYDYNIALPQDESGLVLRNGQEVTFSCTLGLARGQWISRSFGTAIISFDLSYLYFIEKEAAVTVTGVRA